MKKLAILLTGLISTVAALAQTSSGIRFVDGLTWPQVLAKAKTENKPIFIDCYATWCGPCKAMDKEVYTAPAVATVLNDRFICVKVQMDVTRGDSEVIKAWYVDAKSLAETYNVTAYPSFLFFSANGTPLHKAVGYKKPADFVALAQAALDPSKQYYTLLAAYRSSALDYTLIPKFAAMANAAGDEAVAKGMVRDALDHHLNGLDETQLLNKDILRFVASDVRSSDKVFGLFYHQPEKVNTLCGKKDFAQQVVEQVITREEITPVVPKIAKDATTFPPDPDWAAITAAITAKYDAASADHAVLNAKIYWYRATKDYAKLAPITLYKFDTYEPETKGAHGVFTINNAMFDIFVLHTTDRALLARALALQAKVVADNPDETDSRDTYANLLYKLGRTDEAIRAEEKAIAISSSRHNGRPDSVLEENLGKMKHGMPTWPQS